MTKTIMLVHGAWLNSKSWEHWKTRYEAKGFTVVAPDWPGDEGDPVELKAHPRKELIKYGPKEIVAHYAEKISALPEAPFRVSRSASTVYATSPCSTSSTARSTAMISSAHAMRVSVTGPNVILSPLTWYGAEPWLHPDRTSTRSAPNTSDASTPAGTEVSIPSSGSENPVPNAHR